jgi:hypothetical protein
MIKLKQNPGSNAITITAKGKITDDDYEDVIVSAVEAALQEHDKLRFLYVLGEDYDGFEGDAMWEDTKVGMKHFTAYEKIGLVTDVNWIRRSVKAFGFLMPGEVRLFHNDAQNDAEAWLKEE